MASTIYSRLKIITTAGAVATESITGITDARTGVAFAGKFFMVFGLGALNTTSAYWFQTVGFADATGAGWSAGGSESNDFSAKITRYGGANVPIYVPSSSIFGGNALVATLSNIAAGSFDITYTANYAGHSFAILVLGGADLNTKVAALSAAAKQTTTFQPDAALFLWNIVAGSPNSAGGGYASLGFAERNGATGTMAVANQSQGTSARYQRTNKCIALLDSFSALSDERSIVSWQTDGFTQNSAVGSAYYYAALGGVSTAGGVLTQPTGSPASVTLSPGFNPLALIVFSAGKTAGTTVVADQAGWTIGASDGVGSAGVWANEDLQANASPLHGATRFSNADILQFCDAPAGAASTITAKAQVTAWNRSSGDITLTWSTVDAVAREYMWLAVGRAATGPVEYEDPCGITDPRIFATITTETETVKVGVQPLRDTAALGGFAEPRLLDVSAVTRVASDVATGSWSAQTASMRWADTDRANRARSDTRTSFRGCDAELYLTSNAQRAAGLPPRLLFAGTVYEDAADPNLVLSTTINDLIGSNYSLFSEEKQIPQRTIEKNWFPLAPSAAVGQAEPIVGGTRSPLDPAALSAASLPQGVSKGVYVGQVRINGAHGTPTGTTLASVVAALEASRAAGTLYTDYGSRIGYSDATVLQGYGSVPSDYDALAQVIGYGDLDALLAATSNTGGSLFEAVVIASHAIKEILDAANGNPSIWIGTTQVAAAAIGVSVWCPQIPGDASWAAAIGATLYTDVIGADAVTRRYTLVLFDPASANGIAVAGGAVVHVDCIGLEDVGNGTGTAITDAFGLYRHLLNNFILQDYQSGAWLASPQFLFSDGVTLLDRVDADSFTDAATVATLSLTGGRLGSFTLDERASVRDIIARCNQSWGCLLAQDDYQRLIVKVLDTRRTTFLTGRYATAAHRTLDGKRDILPGLTVQAKPDWQVNRLTYQYAKNNFTGSYERDAGGGGTTVFVEDATSQTRDGVIKKTVELAYVRDDATAASVASYYLNLFKDLPRVATYTRRGLCGLEDDVLDGVPITHWNGYGSAGWVDHSVWILGKTFDPKTLTCTFTALDVERLILAAETAATVYLTSDPVAIDDLIADSDGAFLTEG